jgi:hypothetical protein
MTPEHDDKVHPLYKVRIDKAIFEIKDPTPTGRQLLELAGKRPPDQFALYLKVKGGQPQRVGLDQHVDLREPGTEHFVTLPLDQTEGLGARRQFSLPKEDLDWLERRGLRYELASENGVSRVVINNWPVPAGYDQSAVDVNVRIEPGYPDTQIDMAYFFPALSRLDRRAIGAVCQEGFDGRSWQRWSRHRTPANPWRPGVDNLETHFTLVDDWLIRELKK